MQYGKSKDGVSLGRDTYADQFAETDDLKYYYSVSIYNNCIDEDADPKELAKRLKKTAEQFLKIAKFLEKKNVTSTK